MGASWRVSVPKRGHDENGTNDWEESPSGMHRRPLGSSEPWVEKTDPSSVKSAWWTKPVTIPWGLLLAIGGVGAGGGGATMARNLLVPEDVVTDAKLDARLAVISQSQELEQQQTDRKLDGISRDIADLHKDVEALNAILDRAFPRFPDRRDP